MWLQSMSRLMSELDAMPEKIGYPPASIRHEYDRFISQILATAHSYCVAARHDLGNWVPWGGTVFTWAASNPDDAYRFVAVEGTGVYRISGTRGAEDHATLMMRPTGPNTGGGPGPSLGEVDLLAFPVDDQGRFSVILSAERPAAYEGDWVRLDPAATSLFCRQVTLDPAGPVGDWAIERLDRIGPCVPSQEETERVLGNFLGYVPAIVEFNLRELKGLSEREVNTLAPLLFTKAGGMPAQVYHTGFFELAEDEVIVVESDMPDKMGYLGVQLFDRMYCTLDFIHHASSLNHKQAPPDSDGRMRMFLAPADPGFANWLDSGGLKEGGLMWRWHSASSYPDPVMTRMSLAEAQACYGLSPRVSAAERAEAMHRRSIAFQSRRRW
jgi:hypothetical protein